MYIRCYSLLILDTYGNDSLLRVEWGYGRHKELYMVDKLTGAQAIQGADQDINSGIQKKA